MNCGVLGIESRFGGRSIDYCGIEFGGSVKCMFMGTNTEESSFNDGLDAACRSLCDQLHIL